jgi:sugar/nucleoside kinase (ribokinase family)
MTGEPDLLRGIVGQALAAAALTCTRPGADPPTAGELKRFLAEAGNKAPPGSLA